MLKTQVIDGVIFLGTDSAESVISILKEIFPNDRINLQSDTLVESALGSPIHSFLHSEKAPNLVQLAALLMERLGKNHCLANGNKRFASLMALSFLDVNQVSLDNPYAVFLESADKFYNELMSKERYNQQSIAKWLYFVTDTTHVSKKVRTNRLKVIEANLSYAELTSG